MNVLHGYTCQILFLYHGRLNTRGGEGPAYPQCSQTFYRMLNRCGIGTIFLTKHIEKSVFIHFATNAHQIMKAYGHCVHDVRRISHSSYFLSLKKSCLAHHTFNITLKKKHSGV